VGGLSKQSAPAVGVSLRFRSWVWASWVFGGRWCCALRVGVLVGAVCVGTSERAGRTSRGYRSAPQLHCLTAETPDHQVHSVWIQALEAEEPLVAAFPPPCDHLFILYAVMLPGGGRFAPGAVPGCVTCVVCPGRLPTGGLQKKEREAKRRLGSPCVESWCQAGTYIATAIEQRSQHPAAR